MLMDIRDYVDSVLQGSQSQSSASLTPIAQTKAFERQNYINNMIKGVLSKVSYALDAIPPSVDISPGPVDNLAFGGLALANKGFKNLLRSGDDVEKLAGAVIKNRVPLTDDFDTAVDIVKSLGQTGKHPQFEDYMKAMDTIKDESKRQLTPQELAKNPAVDAVIERIQPRLNVEDTAKLPTQVEGKYLYHGTGETALENIAKEGLKPGRHTGNISLSPNEAYAQNWAKGGITPQGKTEGVMLRVNQDLLKTKILPSKSGVKADQLNELISKEVIPPEALEIFKDGKWQPLKSLQVEGLAKEVQLSDKPYNFKYTSDEMPTTGKTITYQGKEVGGIGYGKDLNQKDAWLHNIEIDPQYRNKGIGKKAIDQFFQTSGANKVNGYAESPEAAKFFKSLGAKVDTDGNFTLSKTDFFNQSKGVQNKGGVK